MKELNRFRQFLTEGVIKEDMSIEDVYNDAQKQVKDIYDIDVPMNVVKQWADNYQFPYSREVDPEDEDQYILVYDFGTEERGDFMEWLKDNNLKENDKNDYANSEEVGFENIIYMIIKYMDDKELGVEDINDYLDKMIDRIEELKIKI